MLKETGRSKLIDQFVQIGKARMKPPTRDAKKEIFGKMEAGRAKPSMKVEKALATHFELQRT
eukprot:5676642-Lingulodinium_polyedra.AAC.1